MTTIEAAIVRGHGHFQIEPVELEGPREDEVLVRMVGVGICHTDIDCREWAGGGDPIVLGHEGAGIVEEVGKGIRGFRRGDHVVLSYQSCGHCPACRHGRPAHCGHFHELNFSGERLDGTNAYRGVRGHFFGQSSFATYALATARNLVKVPKNLPLAQLGPLGCGLQTGAGTVVNSLRVGAQSSLAIFGTGAVGLAAVMAARNLKARAIIAVDVRPKRLKLALELGATHAINARRKNVAKAIRQIVPGGVDYALEITGSDAVLAAAVEALSSRGTIAMIANPSGDTGLLRRGQKMLNIIQGDAVPQTFIPKLIRWFRAGKFPLEKLLGFYAFRDINRAVADAQRGRVIKPVLRFD